MIRARVDVALGARRSSAPDAGTDDCARPTTLAEEHTAT